MVGRSDLRMLAKRVMLLAGTCLLTGGGGCERASAQPLPLKARRDIAVARSTRRFDYASLDPRTGLLFVADLANGRVLVFDTRTERLTKTIAGVQGAHGVLAVPELGRVYASATAVDQVVAIDEGSLQIVARTPGGHYPDGIAWNPRQRKIYVSDEHGDTVAVIDVATNKLRKAIAMGGDVGNTQYDAVSGLIYSNVQTSNQLVAIDPKTDSIVSRAGLPGCDGAHGLLIDAPRRLAYIACEDNAKLITFSLAAGAVVDIQPVGEGPDVLAHDDAKAWLYVAGEAGVVSIFDVTKKTPTKIAQGFLSDNAHIVAVDAVTHRAFLPLRNVNGQSVLRVLEPK
jgi:YVTN family beta-propeller protein